MKKREETLERKKDYYKKEAERYARNQLTKFQEEKSKLMGDAEMHEELTHLLKIKE